MKLYVACLVLLLLSEIAFSANITIDAHPVYEKLINTTSNIEVSSNTLTAIVVPNKTSSIDVKSSPIEEVYGSDSALVTIEVSNISFGSFSSVIEVQATGAPFDYSISVYPEFQRVTRGQSASYTIDIDLISGYAELIKLNVSGIPPNSTYSLSPDSGYPTFSSRLTIYTTNDTPVGTYQITITATDSITKQKTVTLEVVSYYVPPPPPPISKTMSFILSEDFILLILFSVLGMYLGGKSPWIAATIGILSLVFLAFKYSDLIAMLVLAMALVITYLIRRILVK